MSEMGKQMSVSSLADGGVPEAGLSAHPRAALPNDRRRERPPHHRRRPAFPGLLEPARVSPPRARPRNAPDAEVYYEDTDGDGFFDKESELFLCPGAEVPTGFESYSGEFDCDPNDSTNTSEKCLGECGCQSTGGSPATGLLGLLAGLVLTLRRRA